LLIGVPGLPLTPRERRGRDRGARRGRQNGSGRGTTANARAASSAVLSDGTALPLRSCGAALTWRLDTGSATKSWRGLTVRLPSQIVNRVKSFEPRFVDIWVPAASATVPRGQCAETRHGALPAALPGGTAGPDDYRMLA